METSWQTGLRSSANSTRALVFLRWVESLVQGQSLNIALPILDPGCGHLPADYLPGREVRRAIRCIGQTDHAFQAGSQEVHGPCRLRNILLSRFASEGVEVELSQILLTGSSTQALDLICRYAVSPGDVVLVDDPCGENLYELLGAHHARIVSVPYTSNGPDTAAFQTVLISAQPKLYITNTAVHDPTGASLSAQTAHKIVSLASTHGVTIVENDVFADFEPRRSARLAALDGLQGVVRIGSFSKTISATVRCGYVAARRDWIEGLAKLQAATSVVGSSPLAAEIIASVLSGPFYGKYMSGLRDRLALEREAAVTRLAPFGIVPWLTPAGGFFLWCRLPDGYDARAIAAGCADQGVALAPGTLFGNSKSARSFLRFNVARLTDARIFDALERSMELRCGRSSGAGGY
ncbi:PLP-dependent aminotransferase family protein [Mesorhizobium sp. NPDC059054]|uniref:aminotransferase-like domain-containing protein n=1 Tax=Mesorhizobium sp. NPDC059054 TaxID=3346711 RepID=UPI0036CB51AC